MPDFAVHNAPFRNIDYSSYVGCMLTANRTLSIPPQTDESHICCWFSCHRGPAKSASCACSVGNPFLPLLTLHILNTPHYNVDPYAVHSNLTKTDHSRIPRPSLNPKPYSCILIQEGSLPEHVSAPARQAPGNSHNTAHGSR